MIPSPAILPNHSISYSLAQTALEACTSHALTLVIPVNISIFSLSLHLISFARMDGAKLTSIDIAHNKAFTAAGHRIPTDDYGEKVDPGGALWGLGHSNGGRFVTIAGGEPIMWEGICLGGIGVSGGTPSQDKVSV